MRTIRRQLIPATILLLIFAVGCGIIYPAATWAVGSVAFSHKVKGSFVSRDGHVVGSSLIAQSFANGNGNPLPQYFQPRPSDAGSGYNALSSGASNLGPGDPRLVGFIPGLNTVNLRGATSKTNPFATPADPYCVPEDAKTGDVVIDPVLGQHFAKNRDGSYVCDPNTVPERAIAYRQLNGLAANAIVPVDAVTAGYSGLDPDISPENAYLQAARVAHARKMPVSEVRALIKSHTNGRQLGFLGEDTVNVLDINLALDKLS